MNRFARIFAVSLSLFAAPAAWACDGDEGPPKAQAPAPAGATTVTYTVDGMHCGGGANKVTAALLKIPGVYTADVDLDKKKAVVAYDSKKVKPEQIKEAIKSAGFKPANVA